MVSRRTGLKVVNIKAAMLSMTSSFHSPSHIGKAIQVGGNQSLVFYKCPPNQINAGVLAGHGLTLDTYSRLFYGLPKHQLSSYHLNQIMKSSPYSNHDGTMVIKRTNTSPVFTYKNLFATSYSVATKKFAVSDIVKESSETMEVDRPPQSDTSPSLDKDESHEDKDVRNACRNLYALASSQEQQQGSSLAESVDESSSSENPSEYLRELETLVHSFHSPKPEQDTKY